MDFQERLAQNRNTPDRTPPPAPNESDMCDYFAISRGLPLVCLELRMSNGRRVGIPYVYLNSLTFDPEKGIEFGTNREIVTITGRRLITLFDHLLRFRVRYIQENMGGDSQEEGLFVESIRIELMV